jgi:hypothetical protein
MIFKTDIHPWIQYLIVILLVCLSGNEVISKDEFLVSFFIFLLILYLTHKKSPLALSDLSVIFLFLMILAAQALSFNFFPLVTNAGFIIRLFIGFAAVRLVNNFPHIYINVMYPICIVSLCFYVPEQIFQAVGHDFASFFTPAVYLIREVFSLPCGPNICDAHIFIYNFEDPREYHTNAGIFWESGAFAGYILLALIFLGLKKDSYAKQFYMTRFLVMMVTLFTTLSTMGFVVCPVVLILHYRPIGKTVVENLGLLSIVFLAFPLLIYGAIRIWNLDFIGSKIIHQYEGAASEVGDPKLTGSRLGGFVFDWKYIKRRPILGWGPHPRTYFALDFQEISLTSGKGGNGLSGFVHKFGLLGFGVFIVAAWKGLHILSGNNFFRSFLAVAAILLILIGQYYLNGPLFLGLMFLGKSRWKSTEENGMNTRDYILDMNLGMTREGAKGLLLHFEKLMSHTISLECLISKVLTKSRCVINFSKISNICPSMKPILQGDTIGSCQGP